MPKKPAKERGPKLYIKPPSEPPTVEIVTSAVVQEKPKSEPRKPTLSRRDRFCMAAMQGLLASGSQHAPTQLAMEAWTFADEMLKELDSE